MVVVDGVFESVSVCGVVTGVPFSFQLFAGSFCCSEVWCVPAGLFGVVLASVGPGDFVGYLSDPAISAISLIQVVKLVTACSMFGAVPGVDESRVLVHCCSVTIFQLLAGDLCGLWVVVCGFSIVKWTMD